MYAHKFIPTEYGLAVLPSSEIPIIYKDKVIGKTRVHETGYAVMSIPNEIIEMINNGTALVRLHRLPFATEVSPAEQTEQITSVEIYDRVS